MNIIACKIQVEFHFCSIEQIQTSLGALLNDTRSNVIKFQYFDKIYKNSI